MLQNKYEKKLVFLEMHIKLVKNKEAYRYNIKARTTKNLNN